MPAHPLGIGVAGEADAVLLLHRDRRVGAEGDHGFPLLPLAGIARVVAGGAVTGFTLLVGHRPVLVAEVAMHIVEDAGGGLARVGIVALEAGIGPLGSICPGRISGRGWPRPAGADRHRCRLGIALGPDRQATECQQTRQEPLRGDSFHIVSFNGKGPGRHPRPGGLNGSHTPCEPCRRPAPARRHGRTRTVQLRWRPLSSLHQRWRRCSSCGWPTHPRRPGCPA